MENFQQTEKPAIKKEELDNKRLTENEALLYQEHATEKQGLAFGEQADEQSYAEAENLINEIREKGIELDRMDLNKINLKDIAKQDELSEMLEKEVAHLAVNNEDAGIMQKIGEVMGAKGIRKIVMLLSLFSILSVQEAEAAKANANSVNQVHKAEQRKQETIHFHGVDASFEYDSEGAPTGCSIKMNKTMGGGEALRMEMVSKKMLVDNYVEVLMQTGENHALHLMQTTLKSEQRNFLLRADLYHKLKQNKMIAEANFVRQIMLQSIVRTEARIGAKIFDRKALGEILNSEK